MTNQEAIEKFKKIKRGNIFLIHQRIEGKEVIEDYSLCDMAISALQAQEVNASWEYAYKVSLSMDNEKAQKPEPCEDVVSRQAAIDAVSRGCQEFRGIFAECEKNLNELPPAQPDLSGYSDRLWRSALWRLAYERGKADANDEIIHCQDCIHAIKDGLCGGYWCKGKAVKSSHYCGYAERRTDEGSD